MQTGIKAVVVDDNPKIAKPYRDERDNVTQLGDSCIVSQYCNTKKQYTVKDIKTIFPNIKMVLKTEYRLEKSPDGKSLQACKVIPHKANNGNTRHIPLTYIACKVNSRTNVFAFDLRTLEMDVTKETIPTTLFTAPYLSKCLDKNSVFTLEEKYNMVRHLGISQKYGTDGNVFANLTFEEFKSKIGFLKEYRLIELEYLKTHNEELYQQSLKGVNEKLKGLFGFSNRGSLTNMRLWLWLLSRNLNDYYFTEYSKQEAVLVIPNELLPRAERIFKG